MVMRKGCGCKAIVKSSISLDFYKQEGTILSKVKTKEKSSSNIYSNVKEIEKMVDRIITKNREKLSKIQSEQIDVERFSLKNKKGETLYYLRKKSDKKTDEDTEILSDKIINPEIN